MSNSGKRSNWLPWVLAVLLFLGAIVVGYMTWLTSLLAIVLFLSLTSGGGLIVWHMTNDKRPNWLTWVLAIVLILSVAFVTVREGLEGNFATRGGGPPMPRSK